MWVCTPLFENLTTVPHQTFVLGCVSQHGTSNLIYLPVTTPPSLYVLHQSRISAPLLTDTVVHEDIASSGKYFLIVWVTCGFNEGLE